ncbi:MAG: hypothetical protein HUU38_31435 [Anaerolineales bacterium]|nr:hypothetical protein [Anaerolineales bacterium]
MLPSASRAIVANFFTASYRIIGKVEVGNSGLLGFLSDPTTSLIQLTDASTARLSEPKRLVDRYNSLQVVKRSLIAIALSQKEEVGPETHSGSGYTRINKYSVRLITSLFEMQGTLEWAGRFELAAMLTSGAGDFFPLYEASLKAIQHPELELGSPAIIFNRRKLDLISFLSDKADV